MYISYKHRRKLRERITLKGAYNFVLYSIFNKEKYIYRKNKRMIKDI
jgi:hypothetical protein